jgi:uncharacterized protein (TIGR02996 family)
MRTFEFVEGGSSKFWIIELLGKQFTVTFGRIGTQGQTQVKKFPDAAKAQKEHDKLVREKLNKGYVETTGRAATPAVGSPSPSPLQESLERALVENPEDLAAHSAYADYLMEQSDPRGEFIQVQLALEDARRSPSERAELERREKDLLKQNGRRWLGDLGRFLHGRKWSGPDKPYHYQFRRGWLDLVRILVSGGYDEVPGLHPIMVAALARSPQARLLRRLELVYDMRYHPFDFDAFLEGPSRALTQAEWEEDPEDELLSPLLESPWLTNLRALKVGFTDSGERMGHSTMVDPFADLDVEQVIRLLQKCPRLDELYLDTHLEDIRRLFALPALGQVRVLQYYFGSEYDSNDRQNVYPLRTLAKNPALTLLTDLRLHPGRDTTIDLKGLEAVLRSPHQPNLTHLQVHMTDFGDRGCRAIVRSGILRRLRSLDLAYGDMTDAGASILAGCPDLEHLELLDVSRNALTVQSVDELTATGIRVIADDQHAQGDDDYLFEVDFK